MIITRTYPSKVASNVFNELLNSLQPNWELAGQNNGNVPVNILETEGGYQIQFNVPGRQKEDFTINLDRNLLSVGYEKKENEEATGQKFLRKEFAFNNFKRTFSVDNKINTEAIEAKYENGILSLFLPKKEEVKTAPKQISVQ